MAKKRTIHVVGTGTLGEPLVNLLLDMKEDVAVDEITFHKNTLVSVIGRVSKA